MCGSAGRNRAVGSKKREGLAVPHRKEHAVALQAFDSARLEIRHEGELAADERLGLRNIRLDAGDYLARPALLAEVHRKTEQFIGLWYALGGLHGPHRDFYLRELFDIDTRLIHCDVLKGSW